MNILDIDKLPKKLLKFLDLAIENAKLSEMSKMHGSIIFNNNTIYGTGYNTTTNTFCGYYGAPSCHAEMNCLKFIISRKKRDHKINMNNKFNILVVRIDSVGNLLDSMPCIMCVKFMQKIGIKNIFYTDGKGHLIMRKVNLITNNDGTYLTEAIKKHIELMPIKLKSLLLS